MIGDIYMQKGNNELNGLLLFSKYAFAPNVLRFCGPKETDVLFDAIAESIESESSSSRKGALSKNFEDLLKRFHGAVPYLQIIAEANNIKDYFDFRVVEAYWIGNLLLKKVDPQNLFSSIEGRFKKNFSKKSWERVMAKPIAGAKPFHAFHVFDIGRKAGLDGLSATKEALDTLDKCRIAWGVVKKTNINGKSISFSMGSVVVEYPSLYIDEAGKLAIGRKKEREYSLLDKSIKAGDIVSLHWDFVCDKLTFRQKTNLVFWTNYHLRLVNQELA